jgi:CYTH domain-containing protein
MAKEIERKFLVSDLSVLEGLVGTPIAQGYVANGGLLVRVRRAGEKAFVTLKGPREGLSCDEWEYSIPVDEAVDMLNRYSTGGKVSKTRYLVPVGDHTFEVDVFEGPLAGLVVAEVEMADENEAVTLPAWLGREVSTDMAYTNVNLAKVGSDGHLLPPVR